MNGLIMMWPKYKDFDGIVELIADYLGIKKDYIYKMLNGEKINPYPEKKDSNELLFGGNLEIEGEKIDYKGIIPMLGEIQEKIKNGKSLTELKTEIDNVIMEAFRTGFYFRA